VAVHTTQHLVTGRQRIDDARFPTSCPRAGEEEDFTLSGLKELFQALEHLAQKHGELRAAVIISGWDIARITRSGTMFGSGI